MKLFGKFVEKRRGSRVQTRLEGVFRVLGPGTTDGLTKERPCLLLNISEQGCNLATAGLNLDGFNLLQCLEDPSARPLEIKVAAAPNIQWPLKGRLRWVNREDDTPETPFRLGIDFEPGCGPPPGWQACCRQGS